MYVVFYRRNNDRHWRTQPFRSHAKASAFKDTLKASGTVEHIRTRYVDFEEDTSHDWRKPDAL